MPQAIRRLVLFQCAADVILAVNDRPAVADLDPFQVRRQLPKFTGCAATDCRDGAAIDVLAKEVIRQWNRLQLLIREEPGRQVTERRVERFASAAGVRE